MFLQPPGGWPYVVTGLWMTRAPRVLPAMGGTRPTHMNEPHGGDACSQTAGLQMTPGHGHSSGRLWAVWGPWTVPALQVKVLESKYILLKPREGSRL